MLKEIIKEIIKDEFSLKTIETKDDVIDLHDNMHVGQICMFRTYSAGVHFGELISKKDQSCILKNSTRVWSWSGSFTLSQLSMEGTSSPDSCKFGVVENLKTIEQVIEIIPMTQIAIDSLNRVIPCKK